MRIPSGTTDQVIYFIAVDAADYVTRETGLSSFTVYRSRNGGTATAMTAPTIAEVSAGNMPGVYTLLLDEDMTITAGDDEQVMLFHVTHTGMAPVTLAIELFRPKATVGETITVASGLATANTTQIEGVDATNQITASVPTAVQIRTEIDSNSTQLTAIVADTNELQTDWVNGGRLDLILDARASQASVDTIGGNVTSILVDTGTDIPATLATIAGYLDTEVAAILAAVDTEIASIITSLNEAKGATFDTATDSLEALRNRGDTAWITGAGGSAPTVGEIADAVWDEAQSAHTTAGTFGEIATEISNILVDTNELQADDYPTTLASITSTLTTIDTLIDAIKAKTDLLTYTVSGQVDANIQSINDVTLTGNGQVGNEFAV